MDARIVKNIFLSSFLCLLIAACFGCRDAAELSDDAGRDEPPQTYAPEVIAGLDADYYIDYENGNIPIGDLPIGARVVDPSWKWEFLLDFYYSNYDGDNHTRPVEIKPVIWIVVAKDHYDGLEPHVTLLAEVLIGLYPFDTSTDRDHVNAELGYSQWGDSGTANATHGLRPWLNSTGIHANEGFYRAFSDSFSEAVLITTLPNKEWNNDKEYTTEDLVFVPSTTELGDTDHEFTYQIGSAYPYFAGANDAERIAMMVGDNWREIVEKHKPGYLDKHNIKGNSWVFWTRSPCPGLSAGVRYVDHDGIFYHHLAINATFGVRPALNLKSEILVSEIKD